MKKLIAIGLVVVLTLALILGTAPVFANNGNGNGNGNGANVIDVNGFHYTLNIHGKKADWNANGDYDHGSTIFVPANSEEWSSFEAPDGTIMDGVKIGIELGPEYLVTDGNGFDEGICTIQLPKDNYSVWIAMRGKPGFTADINAWIYDSDTNISLFKIGEFRVSRKWKDATDDLLWADLSSVTGFEAFDNVYVLDLLQPGGLTLGDVTVEIDEYFWQYLSNGAKLVKVRIYPI